MFYLLYKNMNKTIKGILISIGCVLSINVLYAQNTEIWVEVRPGEVKTVIQDLSSDNLADLQSIQSRFCNDPKNMTRDLSLDIRPGQTKDICIAFHNTSNEPVQLIRWFSEATNNDVGVLVCGWDISNTNNFSKNITPHPTTGIIIPAQNTITQRFRYTSSQQASGIIAGCFGYQLAQTEEIKPGEMFIVVPRKVGYISMQVTWEVYTLGRRDKIQYMYTDNQKWILQIIVAILACWLLITVVKTIHHYQKKPKK